MVETQLADDASVSRRPASREQRAGVQHAPEDITTIGERGRHQGRGQGGARTLVIDGKVRRDDRAAATYLDGRSNRQGQGGVVGEVGRGSRRGGAGPSRRASGCASLRPARSKVRSRLRGWSWPTGRSCRAAWTCRPRDLGDSVQLGLGPLVRTPAAQGVLVDRHAGGAGWPRATISHTRRRPAPPTFGARCSCVSELPSVALTQRLLALCEHPRLATSGVQLVAVGRATGVAGLPESDN